MRISKTRNVLTPKRGTEGSAGLDFFIPWDYPETALQPGQDIVVPSGIYAAIPSGFALIAHNKSGRAIRGLRFGAQVVDEDYQGEIMMHVQNVGESPIEVKPGHALLQFLLLPINYATPQVVPIWELYDEPTERGKGKFNSTGLG